jgi:hypothetical protein
LRSSLNLTPLLISYGPQKIQILMLCLAFLPLIQPHVSPLLRQISTMNKAFREEIEKLQQQALSQAKFQNLHGSMLTEILNMLKQSNRNNVQSTLLPPEAANPPQAFDAGDPIGVAGSG